MLNPEFKAKWVEALESGEYNQARFRLYDDLLNGYCCLGVACKVAGAIFILPNSDENKVALIGKRVISDGDLLASDFLDEIGLTAHEQETLSNMNDGCHSTRQHDFHEIANYIKENL